MTFIRSNTIVPLFVALLLVVAQGQLLIHQTDFEGHSDQPTCEVCIHTSHLGHAAFGNAMAVESFRNTDGYLAFNYRAEDIAFYYALPQPRAPPTSSPS